jgi:hypothetical protein
MKDSHSFDPGSNPGTSTFLTEHALSVAFLEKSLNLVFHHNSENLSSMHRSEAKQTGSYGYEHSS